ncbi:MULTISPECIES: 4-alpha-glucanotransferase [unclassified Mycolicibacterium]|uniref:4-alpha-glucanotransferase n=1 Tax=unclassified Mycolicibacterium TaxID=2636767 RepID=UPI0012DCB0F1|nr:MULTISPECIES: 4-alpha-glucanotransferase [unclassified Mycolicibacterium]MUL85424.1 4-alpha-glucanotransferase [Mycolicibacterium sp. CBMA 329]MUL88812.1 4-alpha-glucanotransferase [Mycolicibacterium sp. CBMA 331]MUM01914.1 4-alpha-glucanotransferase [Mycolicibacterium sp. CBMA 334]MUM24902.1 4-alpha-glucanotransferase [Mycolicibacterium sp. CBMA 295]MUM40459.1 4-alpha-glucanotransferase [Mycolicibacterium sp. CBMA 247]
MTATSSTLLELARRYGVAAEFDDWTGRRTAVAESTLVAVLESLGVPAGTEQERADALAAHDRQYWQRSLPPIVLGRAGVASSFWVHVTHSDPAEVALLLEDGTERTGLRQLENNRPPYDLGDRWIGEATFELPADLPLGYHRLRLQVGELHTDERSGEEHYTDERSREEHYTETPVVISPATLALPTRLGRRRAWGLAVQLYSVRSHNSWGTGDLTDLTDLAVWSATAHGAGFILVNPLHAAAPTAPMEPSPYLPTSRRFGNPLYLRVEAIPEFAAVRHRGRIRGLRTAVNKGADRHPTIDRDTAWQAKRTALEQVYRVDRSAGRELAYTAYRARQGRSLQDFAIWCALAERYGADWHAWPHALQHPANPEVAAFAAANPQAVGFHRWLQWVLDDQLTAAQATAVQAGMELGIMGDLAVGVDPDGADAWALQDVLALGVTAGAPPDEFNQLGQDWSQPPWRPDRLVEQAYEPFRALVNMALRHAGGVRIDHIIGMFRLWWIPKGAAPTEGTYVRYDHEAMIGIIALEAHRAGALVVGEDLGTVEPWVRDYLHDRGLFGTSILWFESDESGRPLPAERWREYCLSSVTTHDLPPTPGYLAGEHVRLREELGLLTRPADEELAADRAAQAAWLDELRRVGLLESGPDTDQIVTALYRYLGRTPSKLLALSLADAVGELRTQNQPGTTDEYPNWRIPLAGPDGRLMLLEEVFADPRAAALGDVMAAITAPAGRAEM